MINRSALVKALIHVLHLYDDAATVLRGAVSIKDSIAHDIVGAELLAVVILYFLDHMLTGKHGIKEVHQQVTVERRAENTLESEIGQRVDVSFFEMLHIFLFFSQRYA